MDINLFTPVADHSSIATPGATSSNVALNVPTSNVSSMTVRVVNATNLLVIIKPGVDSTVAADATKDTPILAGSDVVIAVNPRTTYMAAITASGTATGSIYFQVGFGS